MAILKGFPPSNTISPGPRISDKELQELLSIEGFKPQSDIKVKWKEEDQTTRSIDESSDF